MQTQCSRSIKIRNFDFNSEIFRKVEHVEKCKDWPVVYLIHATPKKKKPCDIYIGETSSFINRVRQHLDDKDKRKQYSYIKIIIDDWYNKSAVLDIEQSLIRLFKCDPHFSVQNKNLGQSSYHDYYQRYEYVKDLGCLWDDLKFKGIKKQSYFEITSSDTYKFSPYTALTVEQRDVCFKAIDNILDVLEGKEKKKTVQLISGAAGTGKTIVAIKILTLLLAAKARHINLSVESEELDSEDEYWQCVQRRLLKYLQAHKTIKIAYVVAMTSLRKTLQCVFRETLKIQLKENDISATKLVIGPAAVAKEKYDVLIVDEAHRLQRRRNISWLDTFNKTAALLNLNPDTTTTLDWILKQSKAQILFYDSAQTVRPTDIPDDDFQKKIVSKGKFDDLVLTTQMRCEGGTSFIEYVDEILRGRAKKRDVENYEFRLYEHFAPMLESIQDKSASSTGKGFSRVVAGDAWNWKSKKKKEEYDIEIEGEKYRWNSKLSGWITSPNAIREIGCVHTTQGFDLAYVGVIIGSDLRYDKESGKVVLNRAKVFDKYMKKGIPKTPEGDRELLEYVINCYKVMLTRGVRGCFVYAVDPEMRDYLKQFIPLATE